MKGTGLFQKKTKRGEKTQGVGVTFGIEMKTTFLHSRSSLHNHIRFQGGSRPPFLSDLTLNCLRLKFLHRQDRMSLFNWLIFLTETRVVFCRQTKFQGILKKCKFWGVPSYDLFASARKAVFPDNSADNQSLDPPI